MADAATMTSPGQASGSPVAHSAAVSTRSSLGQVSELAERSILVDKYLWEHPLAAGLAAEVSILSKEHEARALTISLLASPCL